MKKRRLWTTAIASLAMLSAGVTIATPANAAATLFINCTAQNPPTVVVPAGDVVEITGCSEVKWSKRPQTATITVTDSNNQTIQSGSNLSITYVGPLTVSGIDNGESASFEISVSRGSQVFQITFTGGPASNSNATSTTSVSQPVEVSLSLDLAASGASCREGSTATGVVGTWLALPGAADCTSTSAPNAKLLGWATKADFPVAIAQRQIDNGWGAYELFNDEGKMTAVFIPAGGATFVSAGNTLHPIWAR